MRMTLEELIALLPVPRPWSEGDNIPWNEPAFSARMLREHLSQNHDAASRRSETIDRHVSWIHQTVLSGRPTRLLDLGCGPGLYLSRMAGLSHECVGVDFAPAAIEYARHEAAVEKLPCEYIYGDLRITDFGYGFGLVMQIFGEINVFHPEQAHAILVRARQALLPSGILLLEAHTFDAIKRRGADTPFWESQPCGLFSDRPHLYLEKSYWHEENKASTTRYIAIDAATASVELWASSLQAYTEADYSALLSECGFTDIQFAPSLTGEPIGDSDFVVVMARKPFGRDNNVAHTDMAKKASGFVS